MEYLNIDLIKAHLRLDDEQATHESAILELYGNAAEQVVANVTRMSVDDIMEQYGEVPAAIVQAALMLVDASYQQRSPVSTQSWSVVPYSFDILIKPYLRLTDKCNCNNGV